MSLCKLLHTARVTPRIFVDIFQKIKTNTASALSMQAERVNNYLYAKSNQYLLFLAALKQYLKKFCFVFSVNARRRLAFGSRAANGRRQLVLAFLIWIRQKNPLHLKKDPFSLYVLVQQWSFYAQFLICEQNWPRFHHKTAVSVFTWASPMSRI